MIITQIEDNITKLLKNFSQDNFIFEFLLAYGEPKATIIRLQKGEVLHRKKVLFNKYELEHILDGMVE